MNKKLLWPNKSAQEYHFFGKDVDKKDVDKKRKNLYKKKNIPIGNRLNENMKQKILIFALAFLSNFCFATYQNQSINENYEKFLSALQKVETGGIPNWGEFAVGDFNHAKIPRAIGPYQIWSNYWFDAISYDKSIGGKYSNCNQLSYSKKIVTAYFKRYAPIALKNGNWEVLARTHNGGPTGYKKSATEKYWQKFLKKNPHFQ